jgi:hypothetical protein
LFVAQRRHRDVKNRPAQRIELVSGPATLLYGAVPARRALRERTYEIKI